MGNPTGLSLSPGHACDLNGPDALLPELAAEMLTADKAFDADERVLGLLEAAGKSHVIPSRANRKFKRFYDCPATKRVTSSKLIR